MSVLIEQLLLCLLIGSLVAFLANGKELVAAILLCLLQSFIVGVLLCSARFVSPYSHPVLREMLLFMFEYPIMIVLGGWVVRDFRLTRSRSRSHS